MTNILALPQLAMTATVANNAGWFDVLYLFADPYAVVPLDLTGIAFTAELRSSPADSTPRLTASTAAGTLVNGNTAGSLAFNVPSLKALAAGTYFMDLIANDPIAGITRNLFEAGPATITVLQGVTR